MDSNEYIQKNSSELDKKNQLYPVFLKLDQLELLLVGGGNVELFSIKKKDNLCSLVINLTKLNSLVTHDALLRLTVVKLRV